MKYGDFSSLLIYKYQSGTSARKKVAVLKSNRFWIILLGVLLLLSAAAAFTFRQSPANLACIYQDGKLIHKLDLSVVAEPYIIIVECDAGVNVVAVENGRVCVSEADCPDGSCVRQGWLSGGVTPIVCLPHRLVIELERSEVTDVDAVVR